MTSRAGAFIGALVLLIAGTHCTEAGSRNAPEENALDTAVHDFFAAWNDRDYAEMNRFFTASSYLTDGQLKHEVAGVITDGAITDLRADYTLAPTDIDEEPSSPFSLPYFVDLRSTAAKGRIRLKGEMKWSYDDAVEDAWEVRWQPQLLFPGFARADRLEITSRWLERGSIVDRDGRKLATGDVETRRYPYGSMAGSVVGHIGRATKEQAAALGVEEGALVGGSGLEEGLQEELAGRPETTLSVVARDGSDIKVLGRRKGKPGQKVATTLDVEIQRATQGAFGATNGGAIVMDPKTGDLLAIVSSSPFDPNGYVGVSVEPFNRAIQGLYPPGSSMKVVTASAAIDTGTVTPETRLQGPAEYRGVRNFESGDFGELSFATAVQHSVNTAFAQVALKLGAKELTKYAELFGFNRKPELPLDAAEPSFPFPTDEGDLMWGSIGQAQVLATPLQMASVAATIANDGKRMEPRITTLDKPVGERVVTKETAATMTKLMISVVVGGTGQAARLSGIDVAGKTGTAEVDVGGERKNHAWFICFAPAEDPDVAIAVVSEYGGVGGEVAAPIARQILASTLLIVQSDEFRAGNG